VADDAFDFLLLSLPDNDAWSHKHGPEAQVESIAEADAQLQRLADAAGGIDALLERYAFIVAADHGHTKVREHFNLLDAFTDWNVRTPRTVGHETEEIAISLAQRSAMLYLLDPEANEAAAERAAGDALRAPAVELAMLRGHNETRVLRLGRELRFAAGGDVLDSQGNTWSVEGDLGVLGATIEDGMLVTPNYPDALRRIDSALACRNTGDVLLSAADGAEFIDWGGASHLGGGSHGSLHVSDSHGALLWCGTGPDSRDVKSEWTLRDIAGMVTGHFGIEPARSGAQG
jgi:hypothetical protein